MAFPLYLAMTAAEIREAAALPENLAYMAFHFSPYGTGLSNIPKALPPASLLILNDRTPIHGHNRELIGAQLEEWIEKFHCSGILLDFQRPDCSETAELARHLTSVLPCPIAVSEYYAQPLPCPVFLSPVPPDMPLSEHLRPWTGREIWLEAALDGMECILTDKGSTVLPLPTPEVSGGFQEPALHSHYKLHLEPEAARFTIYRTREDLEDLLAEAEALGVARAVGLWQELKG